jgi:hypothetical protein
MPETLFTQIYLYLTKLIKMKLNITNISILATGIILTGFLYGYIVTRVL